MNDLRKSFQPYKRMGLNESAEPYLIISLKTSDRNLIHFENNISQHTERFQFSNHIRDK